MKSSHPHSTLFAGVQIAYYAIIFSQFSMMVLSVLLAIGVYTVSLALSPPDLGSECDHSWTGESVDWPGWAQNVKREQTRTDEGSRRLPTTFVHALNLPMPKSFLSISPGFSLFSLFSETTTPPLGSLTFCLHASGECGARGAVANWNSDFHLVRGAGTCLRQCSQGSDFRCKFWRFALSAVKVRWVG